MKYAADKNSDWRNQFETTQKCWTTDLVIDSLSKITGH